MKAMIFAAGLGTRLKPITDTKPKALAEVNGISLLERNIAKMVRQDIRTIVVNVHHFPDMVIDKLKEIEQKYGCKILVSDERQELLDTGGGFLNAEKLLIRDANLQHRFGKITSQNNKFLSQISKILSQIIFLGCGNISTNSDEGIMLLHNVDILSDIDFNEMKQKFIDLRCTALLAVQKRETSRYLIFNENDELCGWTNTSTNEKIIKRKCNVEHLYAFSGIQITDESIFDKITLRGKFSLTQMYLELCTDNIIKPYVHNGKWIDAGRMESLEKACKMF